MEKELILVKFTRRHCPRLHHFCTECGHAPELLGCRTVPGGCHVVVMGLVMQDHKPAHYAPMHWAQDLTSVAEDYHGEGFVHDNLRGANYVVPFENQKVYCWSISIGAECGLRRLFLFCSTPPRRLD
jgi:hypothetical protein